MENIDTTIEWVAIDDKYNIGNPLTQNEIEIAVNHLKDKAKIHRVFCHRVRARLYRWLKLTMENCYIDVYAEDMGMVFFTIGADEEAVKDLIAMI